MHTTDTTTPIDALQQVVAVARDTQAADTDTLVAQCRAAGLNEDTIAEGIALWRSHIGVTSPGVFVATTNPPEMLENSILARLQGEENLRHIRPFQNIENDEDTAFDDLQRVVAVARREQTKGVKSLRRACADSGLSEAATTRGIDLWVSTLKEQAKR